MAPVARPASGLPARACVGWLRFARCVPLSGSRRATDDGADFRRAIPCDVLCRLTMRRCWTTSFPSGCGTAWTASTAASSPRSTGTARCSTPTSRSGSRAGPAGCSPRSTTRSSSAPEWLEAARSRASSSPRRHCFAPDGKMYFTVTREGRPLRMRRYVFSESFAAIASAAYAQATGDAARRRGRRQTFATYLRYCFTPGRDAAEVRADPADARASAPHMIGIVTAQELRANLGDVTRARPHLHRVDRPQHRARSSATS